MELACKHQAGHQLICNLHHLSQSALIPIVQAAVSGPVCYPAVRDDLVLFDCAGQCWRYERMTRGRRREVSPSYISLGPWCCLRRMQHTWGKICWLLPSFAICRDSQKPEPGSREWRQRLYHTGTLGKRCFRLDHLVFCTPCRYTSALQKQMSAQC